MAIKKSELYSSLWKSCDVLRGGMDTSVYKDYILVLLFIKYVTDKADAPDALIEVPETEWEERLPNDTTNIVRLRGFEGLRKLKNKKEIGDLINKKIIKPIAEANGLMGIIDIADFNDEKKLGEKGANELVEKLSKLIAVFENPALDFSKNRAADDDILGDAYEYLMRNFATESGKSKGQFYTPSEVSQVVAKVLEIPQEHKNARTTIYDPTCGSGSLLLKVFEETDYKATVYGQEMQFETAGLAKMNMILHKNETARIERGNTLASPAFKVSEHQLEQFHYAVANPPFSYKGWSQGVQVLEDAFNRFELGIPPEQNGDYAFLLHILTSLKPNGKAAIVLPHGVLFRGNAEATIRQNLIERGYIKGIIGLPANLFYGTGIPACIIVLDKDNAQARKGIFFVDASKGFMKDGNKNRLRYQDVHKIVDTFTKQLETPRYARMVSLQEIVANDYNLNIPRYIDSQEPEDLQSIEGHLHGGIPHYDVEALAPYWEAFEGLEEQLVRTVRPQFYAWDTQNFPALMDDCQQKLQARLLERFEQWRAAHEPLLYGINSETNPKQLILHISEDILATFDCLPLVDKYDIYQYLRVYWAEVMQDDAYMVIAEGWKAEIAFDDKLKEMECDLLPKRIVVAHFFEQERATLLREQARQESLKAEMDTLMEEHGGEDGVLYHKNFEGERITDKTIAKRLPETEGEEMEVLKAYLRAMKEEADAKKTARSLEYDLELKILAKYGALAEAESEALQRILMIGHFLRDEQADLHHAERQQEEAELELLLFLELHARNSSVLAPEKKGKKITKAIAEKRLKEMQLWASEDDKQLLQAFLKIAKRCEDAAKRLKDSRQTLENALKDGKEAFLKEADFAEAWRKYTPMTTEEIRYLVIEKKWLASLHENVMGEAARLVSRLSARLKTLEARYSTPLPALQEQVRTLNAQVQKHLAGLGF